jgi:ATP-binding protein involved in chromosome partitioning
MNYTVDQVVSALSQVTHPGFSNDIVSLNMVKDIKINGNKVSFSLTFQKSTDPLIGSIQKACRVALQTKLGPEVEMGEITINSTFKPEVKESTLSKVKNIIAIASGKGGVGKSTVASNLAVSLVKLGYRVGLIDADVYGPSIPKMFNVESVKPELKDPDLIVPVNRYGVKLLSIGFFVDPKDPLVWRGPMATNALKQLINQGEWGELDFLMIDLPPGTGDVHLTLVQELTITGAVIVSTPQDVALADAVKGINMFKGEKINVPVLGLVENMAWFTPAELPANKYYIFGKEGCKRLAEELNIPLLGQIPIVQTICEGGDDGNPSALDDTTIVGSSFKLLAERLVEEVDRRNKELDPTKKVEIIHGKK